MMQLKIFLLFLLLSVFSEYAAAQKVKVFGNVQSYPYIGRIVAEQIGASDEYSMRTYSFPEVSLLNKTKYSFSFSMLIK